MKKLKDIRKNLSPDIDVGKQYTMGKVSVTQKIGTKNTKEILSQGKDIRIETRTDIQIQKNKTKNFDALRPVSFRYSGTIDITKKGFSGYITRLKNTPLGWFYAAISMCVILLFLSINALVVENRVNAGYEKIISLNAGQADISYVKKLVNDARFDFLLSDILFTPFKLFSTEKITIGYHAIKGGKMLSKSLDNTLGLYAKTLEFLEQKSIADIYFTQLFQNIHPEFLSLEDSLRASMFHYNQITNIPDENLRQQFEDQKKNLEFLVGKVSAINNNFSSFLDMFGHSGRKSYLVVFQNSDEIRPTGGFMGSMAVIDIFRGQIQSFEPRDVYSFEWDLKRADYQRVTPPKGIDVLTSSFGLRDANYYINLKDSSEAIKFFVEKSGQNIDGVIYINQNILIDFLKITGDIPFDIIEKNISAENFSEVMSLLVESKIFKEGTQGTPKQILFDFMDVFKKELLKQKKYTQYLQTLIRHIENREIMMYSFTRGENILLRQLGINGDVDYTQSLDFAYPVFTSLSGNKSDRYMQRSFIKNITPGDNCDIETSLTLVSRHGFTPEKAEAIEDLINHFSVSDSPNIRTIQGAGDNYQFVRVILPKNSVVQPKPDMEIRDYGERKGVEFFLRTRPTETVEYTINYTLKNPQCQTYTYEHYKQPGIANYDIQILSPEIQELFTGLEQDFFYGVSP